jgi:hypothetical protein
MRAVLAILLYGLAATFGLAAGYYATAPGSAAERARAREQRAYERHLQQELDEMEAAAAFLSEQERRLGESSPLRASAGL